MSNPRATRSAATNAAATRSAPHRSAPQRFGDRFSGGLAAARDAVRHATGPLIVYLVAQAVLTLAFVPLLSWLFRDALGIAGLRGFDDGAIGTLLASPWSVALIVLLVLVAIVAATAQLLLVLIAIRRTRAGASLHPRALFGELAGVLRRCATPGAVLLVLYVFVILPIGQAGVFSVLTKAIAVPPFVSGELLKSGSGTALYVGFVVAVTIINGLLAFTLPLLVTTTSGPARAMRDSVRTMLRAPFSLIAVAVLIALVGSIAGAIIVALGWLPTWLLEQLLVATGASTRDTIVVPLVASISLALAMLAAAIVAGLVVIAIGAVLLDALERGGHAVRAREGIRMHSVPESAPRASIAGAAAEADPFAAGDALGTDVRAGHRTDRRTATNPTTRTRRIRLVLAAIAATIVAVLTIGNYPAMDAIDDTPAALVLAHRGFTIDTAEVTGGVENTISALDAAAEAGADLVEMDVLQTADGEFVVMHDSTLGRLAGLDVAVADLTLDELTAITVFDAAGHTDRIPSLADYVLRAAELDMQLLIEIKLHGRETPDHVEQLVDRLERLGVLDRNIYHSLDAASVETLKRLRPHLWVGLITAFASETPPDTSADMLVVESYTYSPALLANAHAEGLSVFVWTVNDDRLQHLLLRDDVDGLITDNADAAIDARDAMGRDEPLSAKLADALWRFIVVV